MSVALALVDTGGANLNSVIFALQRLKVEPVLTRDPEVVRSARRVILPGVGAAADSMARLGEAGLVEVIGGLQQPVLGICLGMHLLFSASSEGEVETLGLLDGHVSRMQSTADLRVPHMGWNRVRPAEGVDDPLFAGIEGAPHMYFVHSYQAPASAWTIAESDYGGVFPAAVRQGNFMGVQFHPERSTAAGARLLRNFCTTEVSQWK